MYITVQLDRRAMIMVMWLGLGLDCFLRKHHGNTTVCGGAALLRHVRSRDCIIRYRYDLIVMIRYNEHYTWNKVTTCIHNLLGGQRWVDHYGETVIENQPSGIKCKLTYAKVLLLLLLYFVT